MGKRLIVTEQERESITLLYEQSPKAIERLIKSSFQDVVSITFEDSKVGTFKGGVYQTIDRTNVKIIIDPAEVIQGKTNSFKTAERRGTGNRIKQEMLNILKSFLGIDPSKGRFRIQVYILYTEEI